MFHHRAESGFTLIEVMVVLGIVSVMAAMLAPTITRFIGNARLKKAYHDVSLLSAAVAQFQNDTQLTPVYSSYSTSATPNVDTLIGPGKDPLDKDWMRGRTVDEIKDHLQTNKAGYANSGENAWKGPYLERLRPDPWGNRYVINVRYIQPGELDSKRSCMALSAGPNGKIETPFTGNYVQAVGDDVAARIK